MKIGTYYYPEQWPREQWERDFDNIAALGLRIVHMGEFAWFALEPKPGQFDFDWLAHCVDLAAKRKLDVILGTPTAAPPIWLIDQHPDVLPLDDAGRRKRFGGRRHYSPTSPAMREATTRIVTALADRFAGHPAVIGWQVDNEYSSDFIDQNDHARAAWQAWLRRRFNDSIDALNKAWGSQFWNTYYTDFAQIRLPASRDAAGITGAGTNPHHLLDAARYWSHAFADFNRLQTDILKAKVQSAATQRVADAPGRQDAPDSQLATRNPPPFITTNFMSFAPDVNPADLAGDFTLMAWDSYPCPGNDISPRDQYFRIGDPAQIGFMHDYMASFHGRWGLMELQPGQVNWGATAPHLYPGAVRLWLWTALAHGAEFVTTYRFRQPRFGSELFHHGLVGPDGVTPSLGGREFQQTIDEMERLKLATLAEPPAAPITPATPAEPPLPVPSAIQGTVAAAVATTADAPAPAKTPTTPAPATPGAPVPCVGLVFDFEQLWYFKILPQTRRWNYERLIRLWYGALARLGCSIKVLRPDQEWPSLPLIVCPGLQMVDDAVVDRMHRYVAAGGHLVLTCRTALMDRTGQLFEGPLAKPVLDLIGGSIEAYDGLPDGMTGKVDLDGKEYDWGVWGDLLYNEPDTRILAKYDDQFYEGAAAVIQAKRGPGVCTYCGVFGEEVFTNALAAKLATQAGIAVTAFPPRAHLLRRGPYRILLNYTTAHVEAPAPPRTKFLVGTRKVDPAGVAVWRE